MCQPSDIIKKPTKAQLKKHQQQSKTAVRQQQGSSLEQRQGQGQGQGQDEQQAVIPKTKHNSWHHLTCTTEFGGSLITQLHHAVCHILREYAIIAGAIVELEPKQRFANNDERGFRSSHKWQKDYDRCRYY